MAINAYFRPYEMVLRRCFAEGCSGNQLGESGLDTAAFQIVLQRIMAPVCLQKPQNLQLWTELLQIRALRRRLRHYLKDIRANYPGRVSQK